MRNIIGGLCFAVGACSGVDVEVTRAGDDVVDAGADTSIDDAGDAGPLDDANDAGPTVDAPIDDAPIDDAPLDAGPIDDDGPVLDDSVGDDDDDDDVDVDDDDDDDDDGDDDDPSPPPPVPTDACDETTLPLANIGLIEPAGVDGCPAGMAPIDAHSCMDRWEAFVDVVGAGPGSWSPYEAPAGVDVVARAAAGAVPQSNISGTQAASACANAGKRLCRASEWSFACRGASGFTYPWGNDRRDGVCNDARAVHPAVEYFGTGASWIWSRLDHPCINQLPASLARTGAHEGCVNASGHFDLVGNLHEWIDDAAGTFRGGFYVDTVRNGAGCLYTTTAHAVSHHDYSTGFRCCADR